MDDSRVVELQALSPVFLHDYVVNGTLADLRVAVSHKNIPIDQRNDFQQSALHVACVHGKEDMASLLLELGINHKLKDEEGITALIAASRSGATDCVILLINNGADVHACDSAGWNALMWACYKGHTEVVKSLLCEGASLHLYVSYNMTCLMWAAGRGFSRIVRLLCEKGAKVNATDKFGSTALMWACRKGFVEIVNILFDFKADAEAVGANGANALIQATKNNHSDCAKVILNRSKLNVNHTDKDTNSALSYAAKLGKYETIILLLNYGAYLNLADRNGDTPLIKATKQGHYDAVRALLSRFADVDIKGRNNMTALHWACENGHVGIVRELLACSADTETMNDETETPLLRAVKSKNVTITRMLLDKGAKVTATNKHGDTPLHIAVRARSVRLVKLLLRNPRDGRLLYQPNKEGETPYNLDAAHNKGILSSVFGAKNMSPESAMTEVSGDGIQQSYDLYSSALADILCEPTLTPPLTVGLYAKWGSGKSFLLNKLQEQMKVFTCNNIRIEALKNPGIVTFFIVLFISVFFGLLVASLTSDPSMRMTSGLITGGVIFLLYLILMGLVILGVRIGKWKWAVMAGEFLNNQYNYISLLFKLWFMTPPAVKQTNNGNAIPVRFLFTNYSRLTSVGGETSLAEMIGVLSCLAEKNLGFFAVRLNRAFKTEVRDDTSSTARFRKICCIPTFVIGIFFILSLMAIVLLITMAYGSPTSFLEQGIAAPEVNESLSQYYYSAIIASVAVLAGLEILIIVSILPYLITMIGALIWSQRSRVLSAAHHTKSQEHLMQQLKQEVDLLCQTVIAIDSFTGLQTRMCVTINGLDSCEQDKVLHVLDTVHVLFSQRPYITILAIDPVIISKAIHNNLKSVFRDANITGYDYLKNIVHLPFYLKDKTQVSSSKQRSLADREDGLTDAETDPDDVAVVVDTSRKMSSARTGSFPARRSSGVRRSHKTIDLSRLMYSEDWFNTVSPQLMKRILNIVSLTGRLLRADGLDFSWGRLAAWINLTEQWPYRTSFLIHCINKSETVYAATELLRNVFDKNKHLLSTSDPMIAIDASDERSFCAFLSARFLTVRDIREFLPCTVNLDPKLRELIDEDPYRVPQQVEQPVVKQTLQTPDSIIQRRFGSFSTNDTKEMQEIQTMTTNIPHSSSSFSALSSMASPVMEWSVNEVALQLREVRGLVRSNVERYIDFVQSNNVNGSVLVSCDLDELKKELFAPFGDWCLIKQWIIRLRAHFNTDNQSELLRTPHELPAIYRPFKPNHLSPNRASSSIATKPKSEESLEFTSLRGSDRVAYNLAFKEYLKLQPSANEDSGYVKDHTDMVSGSGSDESLHEKAPLVPGKKISDFSTNGLDTT